MIELVVGTYGTACWLLFVKFKLVPTNSYTVGTALLGGVVLLLSILTAMGFCHPSSHDARLYAVVTQIVPQVRGTVVEVPVVGNKPLKEGDVLFKIDPRPFQYEVDRLQAALKQKNSKVAQLGANAAAAEAASRAARARLLVSESDNERQARLALEQATELIAETKGRLDLANTNLARETQLVAKRVGSQLDLDRSASQATAAQAEHNQALVAQRVAAETLKSGSDRTTAIREDLKRAEAQEREARLALDTVIDGVNPEVRQTMAELDQKRWELDQTTVRAPSDGMAVYVSLRPGQMATPFPMAAPMVFVPKERPILVATFSQNVIAGIQPGMQAEVAFRAYPGRIFKAKVVAVVPIIPEGQRLAAGSLQAATAESAAGRIPVVFEYGDDVAELNLPVGAQATVAVYTHNLHVLGIVRKIILRIKSWENYVPFLGALLDH